MNKILTKTIVALCACCLSASAFSLPSFSRVVSGEAILLWGSDTLTVETIGNTTIEWNTFDIGASEHLNFNQITTGNSLLNTVFDTAPARISGTITSNGAWGVTATELAINGSMAMPAGLRVESGGVIQLSSSNGVTISSMVLSSDGDIQLSSAVSSVAELETYAMFLAGLGLVGMMTRGRKPT